MLLAPTPIFDLENISVAHYEYVDKYVWDMPLDLDPSGIPNFKSAYTSVIRYLISLKDSSNTLIAAASELEKFTQWVLRVKNKHPFVCSELDLIEYFDFIKAPFPSWVSQAAQKRFISIAGERKANPKWRPFSKPRGPNVSPATLRRAHSIISLYFGFCLEQRYIKVNPMDFVKSKSLAPSNQNVSVEKKTLWPEDRELLERVLSKMADEDSKFTREKFIVIAMLNMKLRVSDLAEYRGVIPVMCDFYYRRDSGWWFTAYGKRNKKGDIPANEAVMDALKDYRSYLGLSLYPAAYDETPLLCSVKGSNPVKSTRHIRTLISKIADVAVQEAVRLGWGESELVRLKSFTTHWLRHTGITDDVRAGRPIAHIKEDARHSSLATTSIYIEVNDNERHSTS
jgi:integrase